MGVCCVIGGFCALKKKAWNMEERDEESAEESAIHGGYPGAI
jgi:hypothetical protein